MSGMVYLVGAGPGDPGLITVRGAACLGRADVVVADYLVLPRLLALAPPHAERIVRGPRRSRLHQEEINELLIARAQAGQVVVRLKGGDPFVFGRGGEEAEALVAAGVPFEVVPGVTAAVAVPAYAGIPLTHRGAAGAVALATAHEADAKDKGQVRAEDAGQVAWEALGPGTTTLILYMGLERLDEAMRRLVAAGRPADTPAAVIADGTRPSQRTVVGTVGDIAARVRAAGLAPPALTVVGEVVRLRDKLSWFERRPLHGVRVLVTRAPEQAEATAQHLEALGAEVLLAPAITIAPPESWEPLDRAVAALSRYRLVALASTNAVDALMARLEHAGRDARSLAGVLIAAVGPRTAAALRARSLVPDTVATEMSAEGLTQALAGVELGAGPALLPRAAEGRDTLVAALEARGVKVDAPAAYRSLPVPPAELAWVAEALAAGRIDAVTFGSPRTARALLAALPDAGLLARVVVGAVGPTTAAALAEAGVHVDVVPEEHTFDALVDALVPMLASRR
jgi:uroporphyrinogen III methyltransferase/synthase